MLHYCYTYQIGRPVNILPDYCNLMTYLTPERGIGHICRIRTVRLLLLVPFTRALEQLCQQVSTGYRSVRRLHTIRTELPGKGRISQMVRLSVGPLPAAVHESGCCPLTATLTATDRRRRSSSGGRTVQRHFRVKGHLIRGRIGKLLLGRCHTITIQLLHTVRELLEAARQQYIRLLPLMVYLAGRRGGPLMERYRQMGARFPALCRLIGRRLCRFVQTMRPIRSPFRRSSSTVKRNKT